MQSSIQSGLDQRQKAIMLPRKLEFISLLQIVLFITVATILVHSHLVPGTYYALSEIRNQSAYMQQYRTHRQQTRKPPDISDCLGEVLSIFEKWNPAEFTSGLMFIPDPFTFCVLSYSMLVVVVCLTANIRLRNLTLARFAEFEVLIIYSGQCKLRLCREQWVRMRGHIRKCSVRWYLHQCVNHRTNAGDKHTAGRVVIVLHRMHCF